jgi:hypothetical protein
LPAFAHAQGAITGTVKDASGAVLPGVTVEAASPALIEQSRTATTDSAGEYRIENLRPGVYAITFTLTGFSTFKREGVELTGSFVATINAELKVGALEETVTVSGVTPVVDVQSVARQRVLNQETLEAVPVNRMPAFIAALTPAVNNSTVDVGGNSGPIITGGAMSVHGSRSTDLLTLSNGLSLQSVQTGSAVQGVANMAVYQEITVDTAAGDATQSLGGVRMNMIPAEGGNVFHGAFTGSFANTNFQSTNFDTDLQQRGLAAPNKIKRIWDINPSFGGPLKPNKLWFFSTGRYTGAWNYVTLFANQNAGNPNSWVYLADSSKQEATELNSKSLSGRVTWQGTPKNKFGISYEYTGVCQCNQVSATTSAEAAANVYYDPKSVVQVDWTSPMTNRLLLDANFLYLNLYRIADRENSSTFIPVTDQANGITYRGQSNDNRNISIQYEYRAALSYITGSHAFKVGFNNMQASSSMYTYLIGPPLSYRVNTLTAGQLAGLPVANQFTEYALPSIANANIDDDLGIYAQDKWTRGPLTAYGGLRFEYFKTHFPAMTLGPTTYAPNRNVSTPETAGLHWKDIVPRLGLAYDLSGKGKTAVKVSLNKYVAGQALRGGGSGLGVTTLFGSALTPTNLLINSVARSWTDSNRNFVVDCDLTNQAAQNLSASGGDVCGVGNALFGTNQAGASYDPDILGGWNHRAYNWEFTTGVQHEILPRTSVEVSYFRRSFGNFAVTDNLATAATDYTPFTITVPSDPRLPNGGGYQVTGIDVVPALNNVTRNYITLASKYGEETEVWNGVDVTANLRPRSGMFFSGGMSTGRDSQDNCEVLKRLPEAQFGLPTLAITPSAATIVPAQHCHLQEPFLTQFKFIGSYVIPHVDVQFSAAFQSVPGQQISANYVATNAQIQPSLGRPLSGNAANATIAIVEPGSMYGDRRNQLDLRVGKVLRSKGLKYIVGLDIANALNGNPVLTQQAAYATWLTPQTILTARFYKLSVQVNF